MKNETTTATQMVMATQTGFYRNTLLERGRTFALLAPTDFESKWMVKAPADAPDTIAAPDPRRQLRPGERPAVSALTPLPTLAPAKPGGVDVAQGPTGDRAVI